MKLTRNVTQYAHFFFDQLMPPFMRDTGWIMKPFLYLVLRDTYPYFITFKQTAHLLTKDEFRLCYEKTYGILGRETDLHSASIVQIQKELFSGVVLEAGCGSGYLCGIINTPERTVTGYDIQISQETIEKHKTVSFVEGEIEELPFVDNQFDAVVCTHTLEHVRNLPLALAQLRRVAKKQLVIVVPCQRPYKYTFDLHLHFFPYEFSVYQAFLPPTNGCKVRLEKHGGDWLYIEEYTD